MAIAQPRQDRVELLFHLVEPPFELALAFEGGGRVIIRFPIEVELGAIAESLGTCRRLRSLRRRGERPRNRWITRDDDPVAGLDLVVRGLVGPHRDLLVIDGKDLHR